MNSRYYAIFSVCSQPPKYPCRSPLFLSENRQWHTQNTRTMKHISQADLCDRLCKPSHWDSWKWRSNSESCRWVDWKSMEAALPQGVLGRKPWLLSFCKSSVFSCDPCQCLYNKRTFPHVLQLWYRCNILNPHSKFQRLCSIPSITCASPVLLLLFLQVCTLQVVFLAKCLAEGSIRNIWNNIY